MDLEAEPLSINLCWAPPSPGGGGGGGGNARQNIYR